MPLKINLEISIKGFWKKAATVTLLGKESEGTTASCLIDYDNDYTFENLFEKGHSALSLCYPVDFSLYEKKNWPAFLLDLIPSGAARRILEKKLKIKNSRDHDWKLLNSGGSNPIGNIRVESSETDNLVDDEHLGFQFSEILEKKEDFIEYALSHGAPVSGTTGAGGDAPKFTLSKSINGNWYPGGSISDSFIASEWIIKFLRGRTKADHLILESEENLYQIAEDLGLKGGFKPKYQDNALLIPRFDCIKKESLIHRKGVESLYSAMGVYQFGASVSHEDALKIIQKFTTNPNIEIKEYILRDIYNYLISNTDNHGRNTSFIKNFDGSIELSPIYDCAPMKLDPQVITRSMTWDEIPRNTKCYPLPDYSKLYQWISEINIDVNSLKESISLFKLVLKKLKFDSYRLPEEMVTELEINRKSLLKAL